MSRIRIYTRAIKMYATESKTNTTTRKAYVTTRPYYEGTRLDVPEFPDYVWFKTDVPERIMAIPYEKVLHVEPLVDLPGRKTG